MLLPAVVDDHVGPVQGVFGKPGDEFGVRQNVLAAGFAVGIIPVVAAVYRVLRQAGYRAQLPQHPALEGIRIFGAVELTNQRAGLYAPAGKIDRTAAGTQVDVHGDRLRRRTQTHERRRPHHYADERLHAALVYLHVPGHQPLRHDAAPFVTAVAALPVVAEYARPALKGGLVDKLHAVNRSARRQRDLAAGNGHPSVILNPCTGAIDHNSFWSIDVKSKHNHTSISCTQ